MKRNTCYLLMILLVSVFSCSGLKNRELNTAAQQYKMMNYSVAADYYNMAWERTEFPEAARGLANSYFEMRDFELAESWYQKLERSDNLNNEDRINFAKTLIANSKFDEAKRQLLNYEPTEEENGVNEEELNNLLEIAVSAKDLMNSSKNVQIKNLAEINSEFSDFGALVNGVHLQFASDRLDKDPSMMRVDEYNALKSDIYGWTGNGYLKVYEAKGDWDEFEVDSLYKLEHYESSHHSGPVLEGEDAIFWIKAGKAENGEKKSNGNKKDYTRYPQIFYKWKIDSSWTEFKSLPFNNSFEYAVSDPFWDAKEKRLYFSSNKPGGYGNADLYYSAYLGEDKWAEPVSLGAEVNSHGDERTPFIDRHGHLYFSSDGKGGLGGLDVFKSEPASNKWGKPENVGAPINSTRDDFGFYINHEIPDRGVLSSDRE